TPEGAVQTAPSAFPGAARPLRRPYAPRRARPPRAADGFTDGAPPMLQYSGDRVNGRGPWESRGVVRAPFLSSSPHGAARPRPAASDVTASPATPAPTAAPPAPPATRPGRPCPRSPSADPSSWTPAPSPSSR